MSAPLPDVYLAAEERVFKLGLGRRPGGLARADTPALIEMIGAGRRWVLWKLVQLPGRTKPTNVPFQPGGRQASSTDPRTWSPYEACAARLKAGDFGLGVMLRVGDDPDRPGVGGVDLDQSRDPVSGTIEPWAIEVVDRFKSYTEISPSGTGLRIWFKGRLPFNVFGRRKGPIEVYTSKRFLSVTGNAIDGYPDESVDAQEALEWLWVMRIGKGLTPRRLRDRAVGDERLPALLTNQRIGPMRPRDQGHGGRPGHEPAHPLPGRGRAGNP